MRFSQLTFLQFPARNPPIAYRWKHSITSGVFLVGHHYCCYSEIGHCYLTARNCETRLQLLQASPNDIHSSEKLRNRFCSRSAILKAAPLYMSCKNPYPQSKFRPIALQLTSNWSAFVLHSAGKNNHILPAFWCFSRFLQISMDL